MVCRFEAYMGVATEGAPTAAFDLCQDGSLVSDWAHDAVVWCAAADVMSGKNTAEGTKRFDPQQGATRSQAAKMFVRAWLIASGQVEPYQADEASEPAAQAEAADVQVEATFDDVTTFEAAEAAVEPAETETGEPEATVEATAEAATEEPAAEETVAEVQAPEAEADEPAVEADEATGEADVQAAQLEDAEFDLAA